MVPLGRDPAAPVGQPDVPCGVHVATRPYRGKPGVADAGELAIPTAAQQAVSSERNAFG